MDAPANSTSLSGQRVFSYMHRPLSRAKGTGVRLRRRVVAQVRAIPTQVDPLTRQSCRHCAPSLPLSHTVRGRGTCWSLILDKVEEQWRTAAAVVPRRWRPCLALVGCVRGTVRPGRLARRRLAPSVSDGARKLAQRRFHGAACTGCDYIQKAKNVTARREDRSKCTCTV